MDRVSERTITDASEQSGRIDAAAINSACEHEYGRLAIDEIQQPKTKRRLNSTYSISLPAQV